MKTRRVAREKIFFSLIIIGIIFIIYRLVFSQSARVSRIIKHAKEAIESNDVGGCFRYVSRQYSDSYGNDYKTLRNFFIDFFRDSGNIKIFIIRTKKKFVANRCNVTMQVIINTASSDYGVVRGQEFISLVFSKEDDKLWRCVKGEILATNPFMSPGMAPEANIFWNINGQCFT